MKQKDWFNLTLVFSLLAISLVLISKVLLAIFGILAMICFVISIIPFSEKLPKEKPKPEGKAMTPEEKQKIDDLTYPEMVTLWTSASEEERNRKDEYTLYFSKIMNEKWEKYYDLKYNKIKFQ